ncbi:ABC transporter substrate-binding protein [Aquibacillus albus]|uniref:Peptide/nickel transport system substrate-binding protein n=1 Tax=Aquibacillus albus TaxID=1168171 RepID=A0ABS2N1C7_9BACI|nr:ABC transporter substrate-binding protein [Aquibacillus albus]MBM7571868.1 peptide/nickel transport system substrate-binding protein [Aquibacillus albus]
MKKRLIVFLSLVLLLSFLTACMGSSEGLATSETGDEQETEAEKEPVEEVDPSSISSYNEAPELKELVESGKIPSVEERLPVAEDVMVEEVYEETGVYGGNITIPWKGADDEWTVGKPTEEPLFRFNEDGSRVEPNVAKGYDVNDDATEFTIYLREGMKWSDGVPFTADDVLFYWEHMLTKETFGKSVYDAYFSVDPETGERHMAEVTKVDDYTFKVTHKFSSPDFLKRVAIDNKWFFAPAHFHKTILPEFVGEEKASEIATEWGFADVKSFLKATGYYYWTNVEIPTLRAWVASNDPHSEEFVMKRNPYYWKVDKEGNQLPYVNNFIAKKIQDPSHAMLGMLGGDFNLGKFLVQDFTVLKENEQKADFRVLLWPSVNFTSAAIVLNQGVEDNNLRSLVQNIKFREALSVAVDRHEVTEIVTNGIGEPIQASVPEGLVGHQEGWKDQWAEFNPDRANQLLDEIGLTEKNSNGFRLYEDGSVVTLTITDQNQASAEFLELVKNYYENVGVKVNIKFVDPGTYSDQLYNNQLQATTAIPSVVNVALRPDVLVPLRLGQPWQGDFGLYRESNGEEGTKPEGEIAKLVENWDKLRAASTEEKAMEYANEIYKLHHKNQWLLGYAGPTPSLVVAANSLRNVPEERFFADEFREIGHGHPAQFFIKE